MNLTDKFMYEDEIERLENTIKRLKKEHEQYVSRASVFSARTFCLLRLVGLTEEEIFTWYGLKK